MKIIIDEAALITDEQWEYLADSLAKNRARREIECAAEITLLSIERGEAIAAVLSNVKLSFGLRVLSAANITLHYESLIEPLKLELIELMKKSHVIQK